ncbi:MAG: ATP-binding protein, partial [Rhizobiales bacterium]|nr:ATP-binding protein [Hyphomicrobiales bacterium]
SIRDNAGGISLKDFGRAFRPAAVPADVNGLSEFGMGMKSAACWFASRWHVRTKALGESIVRTVRFDVEKIVHDQIEELEIEEQPADKDEHYTEVVLEELHHVPVRKTLGKIKEHLTDIYRTFIRDGVLDLKFGTESLVFQEPSILRAPYIKEPNGPVRTWRTPIKFDFGDGLKVTGFAALRDPGNYARSGFALFRRGRLIQGSGDEGYRPALIFAQPGSYRYLRLFGELHLEGFDVSHTKDGFRWDENEQPFIELLKEELDKSELPLLRQADGYRAIAARGERMVAAREAVERTAAVLEQNLPDVIEEIAAKPPIETREQALETQPTLASKEIEITFRGEKWRIKVELGDDASEGQWLAISDSTGIASSART